MELIRATLVTVPTATQSACIVPPSPAAGLERSLPQVPSCKYTASATVNVVELLPELVATVRNVPPSIAPEVACKLKSGRVLLPGLDRSGFVNFGSPVAVHPCTPSLPRSVCGPVHQLVATCAISDQPFDGVPL